MTFLDWLDVVQWTGTFSSVVASVWFGWRARHFETLASFHEMRARETAERAEDRERDEWQNGYREGWHDREAAFTKPANDA